MDLIENPADAAKVLQSALRVLALPAAEQIWLFQGGCVPCAVHRAYDLWEKKFAGSEFVLGLTSAQRAALGQVQEANTASARSMECNDNNYMFSSPAMAATRQVAAKALAAFDWPAGEPDVAYLYGRRECSDRLQRLLDREKQAQLDSRRMEPADSRYHAATFRMHGHPLLINPARVSEIEDWEAQHGVKLPGAVREWYTMEGPDLWYRIRSRDYVPPLTELEPLRPALVRGRNDNEAFFALWWASDADLVLIEPREPFSYLLVMSDTDVGIPALVRLDGSEDPPVFIKPDGGDELQPTSPRYSVFQFDQLADSLFGAWRDGSHCLQVNDRLPNDAELTRLRAKLADGPQSRGGWPGWHYRFYSENLLIACGHDYYQQPAEVPFWEIRALSDEALVAALRILRPVADVVAKLADSAPSLSKFMAQVN